jgi:hypothetical protein
MSSHFGLIVPQSREFQVFVGIAADLPCQSQAVVEGSVNARERLTVL